ncbi:hypothetical protein D3C75_849550 [compost metagenome]
MDLVFAITVACIVYLNAAAKESVDSTAARIVDGPVVNDARCRDYRFPVALWPLDIGNAVAGFRIDVGQLQEAGGQSVCGSGFLIALQRFLSRFQPGNAPVHSGI